MPLPITTRGSLILPLLPSPRLRGEGKQRVATRLHACFGEARDTRLGGAATQVIDPGERETDRVERQIDEERELRPAGQSDRLTEAARDQIAAAGADRADEAKRGAALDAGCLHRKRAARFARTACLAQVFLAEDRRNHPIGRAVADAGGDEQNEK